MNEMINGLLVMPGEDPVMIRFDNDTKTIRKLIGGQFQAVSYLGCDDITLLCDVEGKLKGLDPNFWFEGDIIVGPALFVGLNDIGDDFDDIGIIDVKALRELLPCWREKMRSLMEESS